MSVTVTSSTSQAPYTAHSANYDAVTKSQGAEGDGKKINTDTVTISNDA